ncbi:hypothetical protein C8J57DRAFT_1240886 [Mycena rebaudengoi]|nr:hypothetical protein C8J57DRAFT_1240886 [Mycena rebaudengoi]
MRFLLGPHGQSDHRAIIDYLTPDRPIYFNQAVVQPRDCYDVLITCLCETIRYQLEGRRPAKFHSVREDTGAESQPWPIGESDLGLTTRSCADVVRLLLRWAEREPSGHSVFPLLGALIHFWRLFADVVDAPRLVPGLNAHLTNALQTLPSGTLGQCTVASCTMLFYALFQTKQRHKDYVEFQRCLSGILAQIIPQVALMEPSPDLALQYLTYMLPSAVRNSTVLGPNSTEPLMQDNYNAARLQMITCAGQAVCMRVGCDVQPDKAKVTRLCKRCWVVGYCSDLESS